MNKDKTSIVKKFSNLKGYQKDFIEKVLDKLVHVNKIDLDQHYVIVCHSCESEEMIKHGGNRYKCKCCGSTQSITKDTVLYRLQNKDKWVDFVYLMLSEEKPLTLNEIRERIPMTLKTAHDWRHRFLSSMTDICNTFFKNNSEGEVELDEVYFKFKVKGRLGDEKFIDPKSENPTPTEFRKEEENKVVNKFQSIFACLYNRNNGDFTFLPVSVQKKGSVSKDKLETALENIDFTGKTVITDEGRGVRSFVKSLDGVEHKEFNSKNVKNGYMEKGVHNNNINNIMMLFRKWQKDLCGYSTKYQWNYLTWFRLTRMFKNGKSGIDSVIKECVSSKSHNQYKNIFNYYKEFVSV